MPNKVNASQLAVLLGVRKQTISNWINRGYLKPEKKVGLNKIFDLRDVRSAIESNFLKTKPVDWADSEST
jgi:DNA-binding transcriptional MerR regulator